jgi:hypothetical protein
MFSNTLSFLSSRNVSDQVSHPYFVAATRGIELEVFRDKYSDYGFTCPSIPFFLFFAVRIIMKGLITTPSALTSSELEVVTSIQRKC